MKTNPAPIGSAVVKTLAGLCSYLFDLSLDSGIYSALQVACLVCGGDGCWHLK